MDEGLVRPAAGPRRHRMVNVPWYHRTGSSLRRRLGNRADVSPSLRRFAAENHASE